MRQPAASDDEAGSKFLDQAFKYQATLKKDADERQLMEDDKRRLFKLLDQFKDVGDE